MWSYLDEDLQRQTGLAEQVSVHRENQRRKKMAKEAAKTARRREMASVCNDVEACSHINNEMKEGRSLAPLVDISHGDAVFRLVCVRKMNTGGRFDNLLGPMVSRGLIVRALDDGDQCLGCAHHSTKKFFGLGHAADHFRSYGFHRAEEAALTLDNLDDPAARLDGVVSINQAQDNPFFLL